MSPERGVKRRVVGPYAPSLTKRQAARFLHDRIKTKRASRDLMFCHTIFGHELNDVLEAMQSRIPRPLKCQRGTALLCVFGQARPSAPHDVVYLPMSQDLELSLRSPVPVRSARTVELAPGGAW